MLGRALGPVAGLGVGGGGAAGRRANAAGSFIRQHELNVYSVENTSGRFIPIRMVP